MKDFLESVVIIDTESTGLDVNKEEIIELASVTWKENKFQSKVQLFNTINPIPFEASAIHHISRRMVSGLPTFSENIEKIIEMLNLDHSQYLISHNVDYDMPLLISNFERAGKKELLGKFLNKRNWICTLRLARIIYKEFEEKSYKLNYLRYALDLNVPDSAGSHRAFEDAEVCGELLLKLISDGVERNILKSTELLGPQLVNLCYDQKVFFSKWPIPGKHYLHSVKEIPTDYYAWALEKIDRLNPNHPNFDENLEYTIREVLTERFVRSEN